MIVCILPSLLMLFMGESQPGANESAFGKPLFIKDDTFNKNILSDFTNYIDKSFVFRQELITVNSIISSKIFATSQVKDVIMGKEGWLFYSKTIDDYLHKDVISDVEIEKMAEKLKEIQQQCSENDIRFLFVVAPNKNSIYPQYMPYLGEKLSLYKTTEKLFKKLDDKNVTYVNLFNTLKNKDYQVYHKLDTHWNNMGAAIASDEILKTLNHKAENFADNEYSLTRDFNGDLYKMLYPIGTNKDENVTFNKPFSFESEEIIKNADQLEIKTTNKSKSGSVLVFRDSFGSALYPFISESYNNAIFTRKTPYSIDKIIECHTESPLDTVIIVMAERNVNQFNKFIQ